MPILSEKINFAKTWILARKSIWLKFHLSIKWLNFDININFDEIIDFTKNVKFGQFWPKCQFWVKCQFSQN